MGSVSPNVDLMIISFSGEGYIGGFKPYFLLKYLKFCFWLKKKDIQLKIMHIYRGREPPAAD